MRVVVDLRLNAYVFIHVFGKIKVKSNVFCVFYVHKLMFLTPVQNGHQSTSVNTTDTRVESSTRLGGQQVSSTDRRVRSLDSVPSVEPPASTNYRRRSMELRSTSDKPIREVVSGPETLRSSVTGLPTVSPSTGRRRASEIPPRSSAVTSSPGVEQRNAEQLSLQSNRRRHPVANVRHQRRLAGRRPSRHLPLSTQLANSSPLSTSHQSDSSSKVALSNCSGQLNIAPAVNSGLVEGPKVCSHADTRVSKVPDDPWCGMLKTESDAVQNEMESRSSEAGGLRRSTQKTSTSSPPLSVATDVSALCAGGVGSPRVRPGKPPLPNLVPVMHVDLSGGRVGRRHHSQDGVVVLDRYVSADDACVMCCSCSQLFSVAEFLRHTHHHGRGDVRPGVKRLGPLGVAGPGWHEFQHRQVLFGLESTCDVNPPDVDHTAASSTLTEASPSGPADNDDTKNGIDAVESAAAPAVEDAGTTESMENPPPSVNHDMLSTDVVKKMPSTPVVGHGTKAIGAEKCPSAEVCNPSSDASENVAVVVPVTCPAAAVDVSEQRLTRSRRTAAAVVHASESSPPGIPASLRSRSVSAADNTATTAAAPRHSERSCKQRVDVDSASTRHAGGGSGGGNSASSRLELRPRPPPRATAPK